MNGLMQDYPLLLSTLIEHAARNHGATEVVSRDCDGVVRRSDWAGVAARARKVANLLDRLGVEEGDRVASLAWNTSDHLELYFGVPGSGRVLHTVNPRLFQEQINYVIDHGGSRFLFVDRDLLPLAIDIATKLPRIEAVIVLNAHPPHDAEVTCLDYEALLSRETDQYNWPRLNEESACTLCYTSGTTGNPKGVLYSHRSTVLHAFGALIADGMALSALDTVLLAVPLFHVNAWGVPFAAAMSGAKLVLPGPRLDGKSIYTLLRDEKVTFTLGVPTLWMGLFEYLASDVSAGELKALPLQRVLVGGSAASVDLIRKFDKILGVELIHAWGMTETSPLVTVCKPLQHHAGMSEDDLYEFRASQGRSLFGAELRIVDDRGDELPRDGVSTGDLQVRGAWIANRYFGGDEPAVDGEGWFPTGDVARISADGFMRITDRSKDVIKSGGEWISSVDLENVAVSHAGVAEAAVIGVPHPKWQERPLLLVRAAAGQVLKSEDLMAYMADRLARWWLPDDIIFVDSLPHTATGKLSKARLRDAYRYHFAACRDLSGN
ncbi:long-chain fatty acid--CoA ligase [Flavisphingomonas formosensis]|uniref:long-chain fatty acid--CoA ligase n=1 Tax=Flavisphingomonas formosensis TaxID=861534 RepID=UPI0012F7252A|nr:long-chain fatty acid--CoA ligase [Sphingomonas formosensis]